MLRVGLTGGIGSGKTTVARIFESLGIPVYNADTSAKRLMNSDEKLRGEIIKVFGANSYKGTELNRSFLSSEIYNDEKKLDKLNALVHPVVFRDVKSWAEKQTSPYVIEEAAILFESGSNKFQDFIIGVTAPEEFRIRRLKKRDGKTEEEIRFYISRQMDEEKKMSLCDVVIQNDERQMLVPQVLAVHKRLLELAKTFSKKDPPSEETSSL